MAPLPMFPLGMVLVPGAPLPLRVFEPRYRALVADCVAGDGEFGVVLIERGHEVGGGDTRFDVGCVARIVEVGEIPPGHLAVASIGDRRVRIEQWLPDDPYPRADVSDWPDPEPTDDDAHRCVEVAAELRRVLAMAAELGAAVPPAAAVEVADDALLASYQLCSMSPVGPLDQLALLASATVRARLDLLGSLLADTAGVLASRLAGG